MMWKAAGPVNIFAHTPYIQQMYSVQLLKFPLILLVQPPPPSHLPTHAAKHLPDIFSPPLKNMKVHPLHEHILLKNLLLLHEFSLGLNAPRKVCGSDLLSYDISYITVRIGQSFLFLLPGCQGHG